jgi:hypothetical protein
VRAFLSKNDLKETMMYINEQKIFHFDRIRNSGLKNSYISFGKLKIPFEGLAWFWKSKKCKHTILKMRKILVSPGVGGARTIPEILLSIPQ